MLNLVLIQNRKGIEKQIKYKDRGETSIFRSGNRKEKDYEYYTCDYCHKEIKITQKQEDREGGTVKIPNTVSIQIDELVLHNKCLNPALKQISEWKSQ